MSDDPNDRIDPASVRPLRRMPASVTDLRSVRRARARKTCFHRSSLIDLRARVLECAECGSALDPLDVLDELASCSDFETAYNEKERVTTEIEELRKERDVLRAQVTAAKRDARKLDTETRTNYLREALELLRARARSNHIDATYVAHLTTAVLKGHSLELADSVAGNASHLSEQNEKRKRRLG